MLFYYVFFIIFYYAYLEILRPKIYFGEIINGALVLLKNYNGTQLHFSGTPQLYGNYNRDLNDEFSVKCPLNLEFNLTMVSFFIFFPFLFHGCSSSMAALLPWLVWNYKLQEFEFSSSISIVNTQE